MSGHSKWATTKHKKAIVDAKRSASFTKLANVVTIAARNGGDPTMNFQLRLAIDRAKAASMPKENIERALRRAQGKLGDELSEVIYEGYGPGGVAILIQCLTDNRLRSVSNIRAAFNKFGGSLAEAGSVAYLFEKKGEIIIEKNDETRMANDEIEEKIIDSGADDFRIEDDTIIVYTNVADLQSVSKYLEDAGMKLESSQLTYIPKTVLSISEDKQTSLEKLIDVLESDDDVAEVYANVG